MSYVNYNESLYRTGFRPYGQANAARAAALGGAIDHSWGGFGPWVLHGVDGGGQNVFTPGGGWSLHGLGLGDAPIPDGSVVTYTGTWTTGHTALRDQDPQYLVDQVVAALSADGQLTVLSYPQNLNVSFGTQVRNILGQTQQVPVKLILQVTNGQGFQTVNDIISIINHYVYTVSGMIPPPGTITNVQIPSAPTPPGSTPINYQTAGIDPLTGLPYNYQPQPPPPGSTDFTTWLENNALWIGLGIGAFVLLPKLL